MERQEENFPFRPVIIRRPVRSAGSAGKYTIPASNAFGLPRPRLGTGQPCGSLSGAFLPLKPLRLQKVRRRILK